MDIYDDLNFLQDPYSVLRIPRGSDDATIKEAYKLLKKNSSPDDTHIIEKAYQLIKSSLLRERYKLIGNVPFDNLDQIKTISKKPKRLNTNMWFELISHNKTNT